MLPASGFLGCMIRILVVVIAVFGSFKSSHSYSSLCVKEEKYGRLMVIVEFIQGCMLTEIALLETGWLYVSLYCEVWWMICLKLDVF